MNSDDRDTLATFYVRCRNSLKGNTFQPRTIIFSASHTTPSHNLLMIAQFLFVFHGMLNLIAVLTRGTKLAAPKANASE